MLGLKLNHVKRGHRSQVSIDTDGGGGRGVVMVGEGFGVWGWLGSGGLTNMRFKICRMSNIVKMASATSQQTYELTTLACHFSAYWYETRLPAPQQRRDRHDKLATNPDVLTMFSLQPTRNLRTNEFKGQFATYFPPYLEFNFHEFTTDLGPRPHE